MAKGYCYGCNRSDIEVNDTDILGIKHCRKCNGRYKAAMAKCKEQTAFREKVRDKIFGP